MTLTPEEFTYAFVNAFSEGDTAAAYDRYSAPETGQIFDEAEFANFHLHPPTKVHFKNEDHAPLLIVRRTTHWPGLMSGPASRQVKVWVYTRCAASSTNVTE